MKQIFIFDCLKGVEMSYPSFPVMLSDRNGTYNSDYVGSAIAFAIRHAHEVARAPHQKLDRMERVSQFVVSLRTNMSYLSHHDPRRPETFAAADTYRSWQKLLCCKGTWYDIGVLEPHLSGEQFQQIRQWLIEASMRTPQDEVNDIKAELKEAKAAIEVLGHNLTSVKRLAQKGENLIEKFEGFLKQGQPED